MKYLLEFTFNNEVTENYLYDTNLKDPTSQQLNSEFITNLISLESNKKCGHLTIFDNIRLNFTVEEFNNFLINSSEINLVYLYEFFNKTIRVLEILKNALENPTENIINFLNNNPEYFNKLTSSNNIDLSNVIYYNTKFYKKNSIMREEALQYYIEKCAKDKNTTLIFVDTSKLSDAFEEYFENNNLITHEDIFNVITENTKIKNMRTNETIKFSAFSKVCIETVGRYRHEKKEYTNTVKIVFGDENNKKYLTLDVDYSYTEKEDVVYRNKLHYFNEDLYNKTISKENLNASLYLTNNDYSDAPDKKLYKCKKFTDSEEFKCDNLIIALDEIIYFSDEIIGDFSNEVLHNNDD